MLPTKKILTIISLGIVFGGIILLFVINKSRSTIEQKKNEPTNSLDSKTKTGSTESLTEGMMLRGFGTVHYYGQETGGADLDDPSIPPPQIIIYLDNSPVEGAGAVLISDTGCIDDDLFRDDRVLVSGKIVNIILERGVIFLECEQGARVERLQ